MNYFLDTEFTRLPWEKGANLISVGLVNESGQSYYACLKDFAFEGMSEFVRENVVPLLPPESERKSVESIRRELFQFASQPPTQFWSIFPDEEWLIQMGVEVESAAETLRTLGDFDHQLFKRLLGDEYPGNWPQRGSNLNPVVRVIEAEGRIPENLHQHNALAHAQQLQKIWSMYQSRAK